MWTMLHSNTREKIKVTIICSLYAMNRTDGMVKKDGTMNNKAGTMNKEDRTKESVKKNRSDMSGPVHSVQCTHVLIVCPSCVESHIVVL